VWIDGAEQELDQIEYVEYTLHPTFSNPVRKIVDRSSGFRLDESGWGSFTIFAKLVYKGGGETQLTHSLELLYPAGTNYNATASRASGMNEDHLHKLLYETNSWNEWRQKHPKLRPDLGYAELNQLASKATLERNSSIFERFQKRGFQGIDLHEADLHGPKFGSLISAELISETRISAERRSDEAS
jgi:transcription initiation factor IIF auxiliary subunit